MPALKLFFHQPAPGYLAAAAEAVNQGCCYFAAAWTGSASAVETADYAEMPGKETADWAVSVFARAVIEDQIAENPEAAAWTGTVDRAGQDFAEAAVEAEMTGEETAA